MIYNDVLKEVYTLCSMAARPNYDHKDDGIEYWICSDNEHTLYTCERVLTNGKYEWTFRTPFRPSVFDLVDTQWAVKPIEKDSFGRLPTDVESRIDSEIDCD